MTYLENMNSGKATYTGGQPAAARAQDPGGSSMPIADNNYFSSFASFLSKLKPYDNATDAISDISDVGSSSGKQVSFMPAAQQSIDYINADLAKHYGMDASTAYNEAMSNTAYQRAVKDLQAAGLNPALLVQSSYATPAQSPAARSSYSRAGGSTSAKSVDRSGLWQGLGSILSGALTLALTKSPSTAQTVSTVVGQSAKAIAQSMSKR